MNRSVIAVLIIVSIAVGAVAGFFFGDAPGNEGSTDNKDTDNKDTVAEENQVVGYTYTFDNHVSSSVIFQISHNAQHPMWMTAYLDGEKLLFNNGYDCIVTDSTQLLQFTINDHGYSPSYLKSNLVLCFDGVEGKHLLPTGTWE